MEISLTVSVVAPSQVWASSSGPADGFLLEDGTSLFLTEDGDYFIQES